MQTVFFKVRTTLVDALAWVDKDDYRSMFVDSDRRLGSEKSATQLRKKFEALENQLKNLGGQFYENGVLLVNIYKVHIKNGVPHENRPFLILLLPKNCPTLRLEGMGRSKER